MKSRMIRRWSVGISLAVLPFAGGCLQGASESAVTNAANPTSVTVSNAVPEAADAAALAAAATNAPAIDISDAAVRPISGEKPLAADLSSSGPAAELLKLAGSGVDETVILSYITNSASIFNLSADEIIYLKDVGMSGSVITSALQHDLELKGKGVSEPVLGVTPQTGVTSNWIGAAQQPTAAQVAPQAVAPVPAESQPPAPGTEAVAAPAPQAQVTYSTFYGSLAPYGSWVELEGYGPVWQPTVVVVNSEWRPYFDGGHWLYTDHGWYWVSDYSWGWAPFHYGRWFHHHRIGWCWTPDYVWGPAWVTWRYNDVYCGWAPLPPAAYYRPGFGFTYYGSSVGFGFSFGLGFECYSFVHWDHFHDRNHHGHGLPPHDARNAFHNTKAVTRIVGNNNRIINEGISAQRVAAATRTEVRQVSLRESRTPVAGSGRTERFDPARRTMTVYKPETPRTDGGGGMPMERMRTGTGSTPSRVTGTRPSDSVESRFGGTAVAPARQGVTRNTQATTAQSVPRRTDATATQGGSRQGTGLPQAGTTPAARENRGSVSSGTVSRPNVSRPQTTVPRSGSSVQTTPAQPQRSTRTQPSPVSPNRSFTTPAASPSQSAQPAQSPTLNSSRTYQAPSRVERQTTTQPATRSYSMPSSPAPAARQNTAPPVYAPRQYSSPQAESRSSYTAPALAPSAPARQQQYSAPSAPQRSYSAPSAPAQSPSRSVSSPNTSSRNSGGNSGRNRDR